MDLLAVQDCSSLKTEELRCRFQESLSSNCHELLQTCAEGNSIMAFARSTARGLAANPRRLECQFLYDHRGSALYEQITHQPEYYPTRTEDAILAQFAGEIRERTGPVTLLELGSGSSTKTGHLLRAYGDCRGPACYVPIDVSLSALQDAGRSIRSKHGNIQVIGLHSTYEQAIPLFTVASPAMVIFLGSTVGNLPADEVEQFYRAMAEALHPGDYFLLGVDLVKDRRILEAAYNDAAGVTAEFTRNLFARMNRELGAAIALDAVEHLARYSEERQQIEIHARFNRPARIAIQPLRQSFEIGVGEEILVEISRKFKLARLTPELEAFGFETKRVFTDQKHWFALLLMQKGQPVTFS
jgi:L-histidine N-alpha-methyltransferase